MDYTISENIEISAYEAKLTFTEDIRPYLNSEDFSVTIDDLYTNTSNTISFDKFPMYGITNNDPDFSKREKLSFYDHNGLLMYVDGAYTFYFKQLMSCKKDNTEVGFNSSKITIHFDDNKEAVFNSILLPKILRGPKLVQVDPAAIDPVLPEPNERQGFDYDVPIEFPETNRVTTDYLAGDLDGIYVNTYNPDTNVPCYYSSLSAFIDVVDSKIDPVEIASVASYLYDETTNESYDITYTSAATTASVTIPFEDGYAASLVYQEFKQYISADDDKLHKNKLVFDINVNGVPAPEMLSPLLVSVTGGTLNRISPTANALVTITNPNISYYTKPVVVEIIQDGHSTIREDLEFDADGHLTFTLPIAFENVKELDEPITTHILVRAYLNFEHEYWSDEAVKTQTEGFDEADWTYKKTPLNRLEITGAVMVPEDGKITNDQKGELHYVIANTNNDIFNTIYADNVAGANGIYVELICKDSVASISGPFFSYNDTTLYVDYTNIDITTEQSPELTLYAWNVYDTDDYVAAKVKEATSAVSRSYRFYHQDEPIPYFQRFLIDIDNYYPEEIEDGAHWISNDKEELPHAGSARIIVNNPNVEYRDSNNFKYLFNNPDGSVSNPDFSNYASNGDVYFTAYNISLTREHSATNFSVSAWMEADIPNKPVRDIIDETSATATSDWWKYKIVKPDIYPYNYLANFSLYSFSDLTINGGSIGHKDLACRNLIVENGATIYSNIAVAAGCTVTTNSTNHFYGTLSAQAITCNNPSTFDKPIYIGNSVSLNGTTIDTVYGGPNCSYKYHNGGHINHIETWENPVYPDIPGISAEPVLTGTGNYSNNAVFGTPGTYTIGQYNRLDVDNRDHSKIVTFYPGKYYFDTIYTEVDTTFRIENGSSEDGTDCSVMIYANNIVLNNNINLVERSDGPFDFRLYYGGNATASIGVHGTSNAGTIIAPFGTIEFKNAATWVGHVWAQKVILQNGASIDSANI